jgi:hypothetical protein
MLTPATAALYRHHNSPLTTLQRRILSGSDAISVTLLINLGTRTRFLTIEHSRKNPIRPAGDQIIRVQLIDSLCFRERATNIPGGKYDVKWIFCFPELRYVQLMPNDCPFWHRILALLQSLNDRASHSFHLWINNKLNPIFPSCNLSLSVGQTLLDNFMEQVVDGTQYTSPADKLLKARISREKTKSSNHR